MATTQVDIRVRRNQGSHDYVMCEEDSYILFQGDMGLILSLDDASLGKWLRRMVMVGPGVMPR